MDDPHAWLRTADWNAVLRDPARLEPPIRRRLEEENARAEEALAPVRGLRPALAREMRARIREDDSSVPLPDGPWEYYSRYATGGEHPLLCRRPRGGDGGATLLDGDREAEGLPFFRIAAARHAPSHRLFAYAADRNGSEYCEIRFLDLEEGRELPDRIGGAQGDFAWSAASDRIFYTVLDDRHRPRRVMCHRIGAPAGDDELVFDNEAPEFFVGVGATLSGRFVRIDAHDHSDTSETLLVDARRPGPPAAVLPRREGVRYDVADRGDGLYLLTNDGGAVDFRIVRLPLSDPAGARPETVVPHREGRLILDMLVFQDWIVRLEREDALPRIVVRDAATGEEHEVEADGGEAYSLGVAPGFEFRNDTLRVINSSFATPERTYDYDMRSRSRVLRKEQEVPGGHDPGAYVTRRLAATADDGEEVPVSLFHRKDLALDGTTPLLLYGYGAYGHAVPVSFSPNRLSLVDRGFVYAIAHVRGGTDRGYRWYLDGKLEGKENTFKDFVAAGRHLVAEGYAAEGRIVAHGGSAGGLLVGAALNRAPELFGAAIAEVPFVDVLNTMRDETLPLTPPEWSEWGDPIRDEAARRRIASYCPYSNVEGKAYPPVLATAGLTDPRVGYWEPAKWIARLRERSASDAPMLLWTNLEAGHGGAAGRFERLEEVALAWAFALMVMGRADRKPSP